MGIALIPSTVRLWQAAAELPRPFGISLVHGSLLSGPPHPA